MTIHTKTNCIIIETYLKPTPRGLFSLCLLRNARTTRTTIRFWNSFSAWPRIFYTLKKRYAIWQKCWYSYRRRHYYK